MQAENQNKWKKPNNGQFKSIVQTRRQIRDLTSENDKKVKLANENDVKSVDLELVDENQRKIVEQAQPINSTITSRELLNKFVERRLGITVKVETEEKQKTAEKETSPLKSNGKITEEKSNNEKLNMSEKGFESQKRENVEEVLKTGKDTYSEGASVPGLLEIKQMSARKSSPKLDEILIEKHSENFCHNIKKVVGLLEGKSSDVPSYNFQKVRFTRMMVKHSRTKIKVEQVAQLIIDHAENEFEKVRKMEIYGQQDFRFLFEQVEAFFMANYMVKQEEVISKIRVPVKKSNQKNTYIRQRMPILQEINEVFRKIEEEFERIENNKEVDYDGIRKDIEEELRVIGNDENAFLGPKTFEGTLEKRKLDFMNMNMKGLVEGTRKLSETFDRFDHASQSLDLLEENNRINHRKVYDSLYYNVGGVIEMNGVELLRNCFESYPGEFEFRN